MLRLTRTAIGLLTAQYRSVLRKCWAINVGVFALGAIAATVPNEANAAAVSGTGVLCYNGTTVTYHSGVDTCPSGTGTKLATMGAIKSDGTVGEYSTALGYYNTVSGSDSSAFGSRNTVSGDYSSAFGNTNIARGNFSSAFGYSNTVSGSDSSALGYYNTVSGSDSSAFGSRNTVSGSYSAAFGYQNTVGEYSSSYAVGRSNTVSGGNSSAFGNSNTVSGSYSAAFGYRSNAAQNYTTAIGYQAVANVAGTTTQGIISVGHKKNDPRGYATGNYTSDYFSRIINVAAGVEDNDAVNVAQLNAAIAAVGGGYTKGTGISIDENKVISLDSTYLNGNYYTKSQINNAVYSKYFNVNSTGTAASATGTDSVALGAYNAATKNYSSAVGGHNTASGAASSAFGYYNIASGNYSSAFGHVNTARGDYSSAFGSSSYAVQNYTTAIGYHAVANEEVPLDSNNKPTQGIISVGHKNGDPRAQTAGGGTYTSDYFSRIINVANGTDAHDAATVGQMNTALNNYYTKV